MACLFMAIGGMRVHGEEMPIGGELPMLMAVARTLHSDTVIAFDILDEEMAVITGFHFPTGATDTVAYMQSIGEECSMVLPGVFSNRPRATHGKITTSTRSCLDRLRELTATGMSSQVSFDIRGKSVRSLFAVVGNVLGCAFEDNDVADDAIWLVTLRPVSKQELPGIIEALCILGNYEIALVDRATAVVSRSGPKWYRFVTPVIDWEQMGHAKSNATPKLKWVQGKGVNPVGMYEHGKSGIDHFSLHSTNDLTR